MMMMMMTMSGGEGEDEDEGGGGGCPAPLAKRLASRSFAPNYTHLWAEFMVVALAGLPPRPAGWGLFCDCVR
jgi:hypothetical protein